MADVIRGLQPSLDDLIADRRIPVRSTSASGAELLETAIRTQDGADSPGIGKGFGIGHAGGSVLAFEACCGCFAIA